MRKSAVPYRGFPPQVGEHKVKQCADSKRTATKDSSKVENAGCGFQRRDLDYVFETDTWLVS